MRSLWGRDWISIDVTTHNMKWRTTWWRWWFRWTHARNRSTRLLHTTFLNLFFQNSSFTGLRDLKLRSHLFLSPCKSPHVQLRVWNLHHTVYSGSLLKKRRWRSSCRREEKIRPQHPMIWVLERVVSTLFQQDTHAFKELDIPPDSCYNLQLHNTNTTSWQEKMSVTSNPNLCRDKCGYR